MTWGTDPALEVTEVWREVAQRVGGTFTTRATGDWPIVQVVEPRWILTLQCAPGDAGLYTRLQAPYANPGRFRFLLRDEGLFDDLLKTLGFLQDVEVGERGFDRRYLIRGYPAARIRELLDPRARELIGAQPRIDLRVESLSARTLGAPRGVDQLVFIEPGQILEVERLVGLVDLFRHLLPRLVPGGGPEESPPDLVDRLLAPGGTIRLEWSRLLAWDGDAPRRDAARRLGEVGGKAEVPALLSVLDDEDPGLVAAAVDALARLGDRRAVPALTHLLGRREAQVAPGEGGDLDTVADHAAEALRTLGEAPLVDAFVAALDGDAAGLQALAGERRDGVVHALMEVVDSHDFTARVHAAAALGILGAREALPLLRSRSRAWGMRTRLTEAASRAVDEIEARARLPRPASRPEETDRSGTLPRPATPTGPGAPGSDPAVQEG